MDAEEVVAGLQQINDSLSNLPGSMEINFSVDDTATETITSIKEELEALPDEANITITAEDAATDTLTEISSSLEELPVEARITVTIFDDFVTETLNSIQDRIDNLPDEVKLTITAEDTATDVLDKISEELEGATHTITIKAEDDATDVMNSIKEVLEELPAEYTIKISVDDEATGTITTVREALDSIPDEVRSVLDVDDGDSLKVIEDVKSRLEDIDGANAAATVTVEGAETSEEVISDLSEKLKEVDGADASATVTVEGADEAIGSTNDLNLNFSALSKTVAGAGAAIGSYKLLVEGLDYYKAIGLAQRYTDATDEQRRAMEKLVQENMSVKLGMAGTAQVMTLLARYTGDANEAMGYFKAVMDAIKVTGEDSTAVTLTLMNTFREFGVSTRDAYGEMALLIELFNRSGFPSFTQFLSIVDRLGLTLGQMGFSLEDVARIVASVGPQGSLILRGFTSQLYKLNSEWERGGPEAEEYAKKLEKFGIVTRDSSGHLRSLRDVIFEFIEYLQSLPDHETRVKVATEVFGDSMGKALVAIAENYDKVKDASKESAEQQVKDVKKVNAEALPPLQRMMKYIEKLVPAIGQIAPALSETIMTLSSIAVLDEMWFDGRIKGAITRVAERLKSSISRLIPSSVKDAVKDASRRIKDIIKDTLKGLADDAARLISDALKRVAESIRARTPSLTSAVKDALSRARDALKRILGDETGRLTPKIEIPAEFKFKLPKIDLTIGDTQIDDAARTLLERFTGGVDDAARVSIPELGSRIGSLLIRGIGEGVGVALLSVDILANFREYLNRALSDPTSLFGPTPLSLLPDSIKNMFSPEKLFEGIYGPEKWSKLKEALMQNIKTYIEDPIREELSKLFRDPGKYIIEGFGQVWNDFKVWVMTRIPTFKWPQLPKLPLPNPVTALQEMWNKFTGWVKEHIPTFKWPKVPNISMPNLVALIQQAWNKFLAWVKEHVPKFKWPKLPSPSMPNLVSLISKVWSSFTSWIKSRFSGFKWPKLPLPDFSGIAAQFRSWGSRFISNLAAGIRSAIPNLNSVLSIIRRLLPSSPPKEGPLSSLTYDVMREYGYLLGRHFNEGLAATIPNTISSIGSPQFLPSQLSSESRARGGLYSQDVNLQIQTHVYVDKVESDIDLEEMAEKISTRINNKIFQEMRRNGKNPYLIAEGVQRRTIFSD